MTKMNLFNKVVAAAAVVVVAGMAMIGSLLLNLDIDDPYDPYE